MRRIPAWSMGAALTALLLAGCGSDPARDANNDIPFTSCSAADCTGTLPGGAEFDIILPEDWNGTLAIYSHSLDGPGAVAPSEDPDQAPAASTQPDSSEAAPSRSAAAPSRSGAAPSRSGAAPSRSATSATPTPSVPTDDIDPQPGGPELAPLWDDGDRSIADVMLQSGYAIAGATPAQQGWVVADQIAAAEQLHDYFVATIGRPNRVYVWGESTGGLTSARLAELHPDWVSGALAMCAPLSGPVPSYNLALDVGYAVRALLDPNLKLFGYSSADEARRERNRAVAAVQQAVTGKTEQQAKVAFIAAIGLLPTASRTDPGLTWAGQLQANAAGIVNLLEQTTVQRQALEQRVAGNFSGNGGTDYALRITDQQRQQLDDIDEGLTDTLLQQLATGSRVVPDPAAVEAMSTEGTLTGSLEVPVVTLHNALDPVYIAENVSAYDSRLADTGTEEEANLVTIFALPPQSVSAADPATEGIGNCDFATRTLLGAMIQLNQWVRSDVYPGRDTAASAFKDQAVSLDYDPGPWPQMSAEPTS